MLCDKETHIFWEGAIAKDEEFFVVRGEVYGSPYSHFVIKDGSLAELPRDGGEIHESIFRFLLKKFSSKKNAEIFVSKYTVEHTENREFKHLFVEPASKELIESFQGKGRTL